MEQGDWQNWRQNIHLWLSELETVS